MGNRRILFATAALAGGLALAGLVAAQDANRTGAAVSAGPAPGAAAAPAAPATPPVVTTTPATPAAKALANAVTPDEGPPPPETEAEPALKAESPPPADTPPPEPVKRPRYAAAVMQAVDKLTAETLRFETRVGEPVRFKGMVLTVRACETTAVDETAPDNIAFVDVQSQPLNSSVQARQVFRGWMFASSPSLHPFEHPIYDLWLIACKTSAPVDEPPAAPPSAPKSPPLPARAPANRT